MAVQAAIAGVGAAASIFGGLSAKKKAKRAAAEQAKLTFSQRMEELRRARLAAEQRIGAGVAATGASNVQFTGTPQRYIDSMREIARYDQAYGYTAALKERTAIKRGASGAGAGLIAQGVGDLLGLAAGRMFQQNAPGIDTDPGLGSTWAGNDPFGPGGTYG